MDREKVLEALENSKAAVESAINALQEELPEAEKAAEQAELETEEAPKFDFITALHEAGISHVEDKIITIPTAYGTAALWKPSKDLDKVVIQLNSNQLDYAKMTGKKDPIDWMPVTIDGDVIYPLFLRQTGNGEETRWILFWKHTRDWDVDDNYILPIRTDGKALAENEPPIGVSSCAVDAVLAVIRTMITLDSLTFELPEVYYKVTKPGMVCKGKQYQLHRIYTHDVNRDGDLVLYENGFHFATNILAAVSWYRFSTDNELYRVQVGKNRKIDERGVGVTDSLLFLDQLDWSRLTIE